MPSRRHFILLFPLAGAALVGAQTATAQVTDVDPKDPQAIALGYVTDASKVDKAKYARYAPGQICANCALYQSTQSTPLAPVAPCPIFQNKNVAANAWCSAYVKKV